MESFISNYVLNLICYTLLIFLGIPAVFIGARNEMKDKMVGVRRHYAIPTKTMHKDIRKYKIGLIIFSIFIPIIWVFFLWIAIPYYKDLPLLISKEYECVEGVIESEYSSKGNISVWIDSTHVRFGPWRIPELNHNKKYKFLYLPYSSEVVYGEELD